MSKVEVITWQQKENDKLKVVQTMKPKERLLLMFKLMALSHYLGPARKTKKSSNVIEVRLLNGTK